MGQKCVPVVGSDSKSHVTVLACVNAAGYAIPPMIIYARSNLSQQLTRDEVPGTMYGLSPNSGWIDSELFTEWFERHFLLYAPAGRPILLMLDGHSSHHDSHFIRSAAEKGVIVFMLPPNTTHIAQPLDNTPFKCLEGCWDDECNTHMSENPGKVITIYQFSELFAAVWWKAMTPRNITSGFHATGVFPVNRDAIEIPGVKQRSKATPLAAVAKKNGINYLPLFSPAPRKPRARSSTSLEFTDEMDLFQRRYEEEYDISGNLRYEAWLEMCHPDVSVSRELFPQSMQSLHETDAEETDAEAHEMDGNQPVELPVKNAKLGHILKVPAPPGAQKSHETRGTRVLTSSDYLAEIEEKERIKTGKG